jgi:hypothetical protein
MTLQDSAPVCLTHAETNNALEPGSSQTRVIFISIGYVNGHNYAQSLGIYLTSYNFYLSSQRRDVRR